MEIYQKHRDHGMHVATNVQEAEVNRKAGWVDITKEEFYYREQNDPKSDKYLGEVTTHTVQVTQEEIELEQLRASFTDKFGKPPHHNMKAENIKKALEDGGND